MGLQISTFYRVPVRVKKRSPIPKPNPKMFMIWLFVLLRSFRNKHLETKAEHMEMGGNCHMAGRGGRRKWRQGGERESRRVTVESAHPPESIQHMPLGEFKTDTGNVALSLHSVLVPTYWGQLASKDGSFPSTWSQDTTTYKAQPEKLRDGLQPWKAINKEYGAPRDSTRLIVWEV